MGMECFHDAPDPSGIIFGQRIIENGGMASISDKCLSFSTILEKSGPQIPNSFRKSQPHTASQAKVLCRKWSYTDPLIMRVFEKMCHRGPKTFDFP